MGRRLIRARRPGSYCSAQRFNSFAQCRQFGVAGVKRPFPDGQRPLNEDVRIGVARLSLAK
jgi:hypothetical protein